MHIMPAVHKVSLAYFLVGRRLLRLLTGCIALGGLLRGFRIRLENYAREGFCVLGRWMIARPRHASKLSHMRT
ncbi:uncharacterized protein B0H64DRAFT_403669 [Chaetomium fimeti]|uniref:Uncharacterized protein n=1 Tax=Chaetomium fimeti TaxID=1854472 RepID=A0AAE0HAZ3_9PEZI|nr:hypothetical protein B0H64DRAFT_403669 [Chaetomium fimeti]